jgi:phosphoglycolate phosphatase
MSLAQPPLAAILDLDGTLVDTLGDFERALHRMLADLELPPVPRAFIRRTVGKGSEYLIRQVLAEQLRRPVEALDRALYERAWASYQSHYRAVNGQHAEVFPGVREGLEALRAAGLPLACLTNKPCAFARDLLRAKGLEGYFGHVFGGDSFARQKPDPLPLLETCRALGTPPARTLMIGDSLNDALAARAAGCPVVLVSYGYNHGQPVHSVDADAWIDRLDQLRLAA